MNEAYPETWFCIWGQSAGMKVGEGHVHDVSWFVLLSMFLGYIMYRDCQIICGCQVNDVFYVVSTVEFLSLSTTLHTSLQRQALLIRNGAFVCRIVPSPNDNMYCIYIYNIYILFLFIGIYSRGPQRSGSLQNLKLLERVLIFREVFIITLPTPN